MFEGRVLLFSFLFHLHFISCLILTLLDFFVSFPGSLEPCRQHASPPPSSHPFGSAWEAKGLTLVLTSGSSRRGTGRDLGLGSLQPPPALQLIFKELVSPFMNRGFLALSPLLIGATERGIPSLLRVLHLHPTPRTGFALPPFRVPASPASSALLLCPNWSLVVSVVWVSCLTSLRKWCAQSVNSFTTNAFGKPRVTVSLLEICPPLTGECWTLYRAAL